MSNRQLEDMAEEAQADAVAVALGISRDELDELDWSLQSHDSDDGVHYGWNVYFGPQSSAEVLGRLGGLTNGEWVRIGPLSTDS